MQNTAALEMAGTVGFDVLMVTRLETQKSAMEKALGPHGPTFE